MRTRNVPLPRGICRDNDRMLPTEQERSMLATDPHQNSKMQVCQPKTQSPSKMFVSKNTGVFKLQHSEAPTSQ